LCDLGSVCSEDEVWMAPISARRKHDLNPRWLAAAVAATIRQIVSERLKLFAASA
jgi:hypothetical protein